MRINIAKDAFWFCMAGMAVVVITVPAAAQDRDSWSSPSQSFDRDRQDPGSRNYGVSNEQTDYRDMGETSTRDRMMMRDYDNRPRYRGMDEDFRGKAFDESTTRRDVADYGTDWAGDFEDFDDFNEYGAARSRMDFDDFNEYGAVRSRMDANDFYDDESRRTSPGTVGTGVSDDYFERYRDNASSDSVLDASHSEDDEFDSIFEPKGAGLSSGMMMSGNDSNEFYTNDWYEENSTFEAWYR